MWWAYIRGGLYSGGLYSGGGLIFGGAYSRRFTVLFLSCQSKCLPALSSETHSHLFLQQIHVMIAITIMIKMNTPPATAAIIMIDCPSSFEVCAIILVAAWGSLVVVSFAVSTGFVVVVRVVGGAVVVVGGTVVVVAAARKNKVKTSSMFVLVYYLELGWGYRL